MATKTQLLQRNLQQQVQARTEARKQAEAQRKALLEQQKQQAETQAKVQSQSQQQIAYGTLNEQIKRTYEKYGGKSLSGRSIREVKEAFSKAGLNPAEGEKLYIDAIKSGEAYKGAKALATGGAYISGAKFIQGQGYVSPVGYTDKSGKIVEQSVKPSYAIGLGYKPIYTQADLSSAYASSQQLPSIDRGEIGKLIQTKQQSISSEKKRYENLGHTYSEAQKLAQESIKQGGVTFNPIEARNIIYRESTPLQKVGIRLGNISKSKGVSAVLDTSLKDIRGVSGLVPSTSGATFVSEFYGYVPDELRPLKATPENISTYVGALIELGKGNITRKQFNGIANTLKISEKDINKIKDWYSKATVSDVVGLPAKGVRGVSEFVGEQYSDILQKVGILLGNIAESKGVSIGLDTPIKDIRGISGLVPSTSAATLVAEGYGYVPDELRSLKATPENISTYVGALIELGKGNITRKQFNGIANTLKISEKDINKIKDWYSKATVSDVVGLPAKGVRGVSEFVGEQYSDIYSQIPEEKRISFVPAQEELQLVQRYRKGEITKEFLESERERIKKTITPEVVEKGAKGIVEFGSYLVPGAAPVLLASEAVKARSDYLNADKIALEQAEKDWKKYDGDATKEEFMSSVLPTYKEEVRNQALIAMGVSGGLIAGGALWKIGSKLKKYIPRKKFTFGGRKLSQVQYNKLKKVSEEIKKGVKPYEKESIDLFNTKGPLSPKLTSASSGKGVSKEISRELTSIEASTFADDLVKLDIFKNKEEAIKFIKGARNTKTLVTRPFEKLAGFDSSINLGLGTTAETYASSLSFGKGGVEKSLTVTYQLGSRGRPINKAFQLTVTPKNSKFVETYVFKFGKKGNYNLVDKFATKINLVRETKEAGNILERAYSPEYRRIKFDKVKYSADDLSKLWSETPSKSDLKKLFGSGKKAKRQEIIEQIKKTGYDAELLFNIQGDKIALRSTLGTKYESKFFGAGVREEQLFKIPKPPKPTTVYFKKINQIPKGGDVFFGGESPVVSKITSKLEIPSPKIIPSPTKLKLPTIRTTPVKEVVSKTIKKEFPLMVGGAGITSIPWAGTGQYERTESVGIAPTTLPSITERVLTTKPFFETKPTSILETKPVNVLNIGSTKITQKYFQPIETMSFLKPKIVQTYQQPRVLELFAQPKIIQKFQQPRIVQTYQQPRIVQTFTKPKVIQKYAQPKVTQQVYRPRVRSISVDKRISFVPKIKLRLREKPPLNVLIKRRKKQILKEGFGFEIRRKGKWERANIPFSFATKEGAEAVAIEKTLGEAAASFRVVKSKKPIVSTRKRATAFQRYLFRPGKEKGVKVQKKKLRIISPGEVKEISLVGAKVRRGTSKSPWEIKKPKKITKRKSTTKKKSKSKTKKRRKKK